VQHVGLFPGMVMQRVFVHEEYDIPNALTIGRQSAIISRALRTV